MKILLKNIVNSPILHMKWLNTLSYLENCGARKIAACEHPTLVREEVLKHAAEEFRHAHYLKKQIKRISSQTFENYSLSHMLGGISSLNYLNALDLHTSRYLSQKVSNYSIKASAYLLVTYAIELRAQSLYPVYEEVLRETNSKVTVKSIVLEEEEHLNEMIRGLEKMPAGICYAKQICIYEQKLFERWLVALEQDVAIGIHNESPADALW